MKNKYNETSFIKENWSFLLVFLGMLISGIYIAIRKDNIYIPVHDCLDSHVAWFKMMKDNALYFSYDKSFVPFLGGLDRNYLYSELKIFSLIYAFLPTFWAYVSVGYLRIVISVLGFYFLGKSLYSNFDNKKHIYVLIGSIYGLLPVSPTIALGFAYMPALLANIILFYRHKNLTNFLGALAYTFLSEFVYFGIFVCGYLLFFLIIEYVRTRKLDKGIVILLVSISIMYVIVEWRLFYVILFSGEQTIREIMSRGGQSFYEALKTMLLVFLCSQYHADAVQLYFVCPVCLLYFGAHNFNLHRTKQYKAVFTDVFNWILLALIFNSVIYGLNQYTPFCEIIEILCPPLKGLQLSRTHMFNPFLWYLAFAIVVSHIFSKIKWRKTLSYVIVFISFFVLSMTNSIYNHIFLNLASFVYEPIRGKEFPLLTYREFYSEELFENIKEKINYNGEWSVAFGMHPSIIEYNGISSLDGYLSYYPVEYKAKFRELIKPDLDIDEHNAKYYDSWGGRAYIFSTEVGYEPTKNLGVNEATLRVNIDAFRGMNGKYIFSRVKVINASDLGLKSIGVFTDSQSPYTIYVYSI